MAKYLEVAAKGKRGLNWDGVRDEPYPGCMVYDMTKLPMRGVSDNTYDGVYSEHFIEHLTKEEGEDYLFEMLRIMKPGGIIRTVWPSMDVVDWLRSSENLDDHPFVQHYYQFYIVKEKFAPPGKEHLSMQEQVAEGLLWQKGEHKYLWYKKELMDKLKELGYKMVKEYEYMASGCSEFKNIDTPGMIRKLHSAVVEATKPW